MQLILWTRRNNVHKNYRKTDPETDVVASNAGAHSKTGINYFKLVTDAIVYNVMHASV